MKMKCYSKPVHIIAVVSAVVGISVLAGCSTPVQSRSVEPSGFLKDYSMLKPGEGGQAKLVYINPSAEFSKYKKIILEPIAVYAGEKSSLKNLSQEECQGLVNYLDATVREHLSENYQFVTESSPDAMRLRIAITDGSKAKVLLNTTSSVIPFALAADVLKFAATGKHLAIGEASVEMELTDSLSGTRLAAAVDARAGRKSLVSGNFTQWGDVHDAYNYWAGRLNKRLAELSEK